MFEELTNRASKLPIGSNDHELIVALRSNQGFDTVQWVELPPMGSPRQDLEAILEGTHLFRRGLQDDTNKSPTGWPAGIDSSFLGFEATSSRPADLADQCSDPLEIESFASKCHVPGGFRPVDQDDRQWPDPIDSLAPEAVESPTISSCPNGGTMPEKMRSALLQLAFGNDANNCYINSVLLAELLGLLHGQLLWVANHR